MKKSHKIRNYSLLIVTCLIESYFIQNGMGPDFLSHFLSWAVALGMPAMTACAFLLSDETKVKMPKKQKEMPIPQQKVEEENKPNLPSQKELTMARVNKLKKMYNANRLTYFNRYIESIASQVERFESKARKLRKYNSSKVEAITNNFYTIIYRNMENCLDIMEDFDNQEYQDFIMGKLFLSKEESERKKKVFERPFVMISNSIDKVEEYLLEIDELLTMLQESNTPQEWDNDTLITLKRLDELITDQEEKNELNREIGKKVAKQYLNS